jgi:hypothetical protein
MRAQSQYARCVHRARVQIFAALIALSFALGAREVRAQGALLPPDLIALDSPEGQRLFLDASAREDFWRLTATFVTQERPSYCGVASSVMILNALPIARPEAEPAPSFTQENFFNEAAKLVHPAEAVGRGGMTIDQLAALLQCHPAEARVVRASETTLEEFRKLASQNLANAGDYVVVNYDRSELGQETTGHISPLAAYNEKADRFLLLDVARYKYPPVWASAEALFRAMKATDLTSGQSRGMVLVKTAPSAPGPGPAKPARSPLVKFAVLLVVAFVTGGGMGAGIATWVSRRKRARG